MDDTMVDSIRGILNRDRNLYENIVLIKRELAWMDSLMELKSTVGSNLLLTFPKIDNNAVVLDDLTQVEMDLIRDMVNRRLVSKELEYVALSLPTTKEEENED